MFLTNFIMGNRKFVPMKDCANQSLSYYSSWTKDIVFYNSSID